MESSLQHDHEEKRRFRGMWISDTHPGRASCQAQILLNFLRHTESEHLYLLGDIADGRQLRRGWFWLQSHNDVVQKILKEARKGSRVRCNADGSSVPIEVPAMLSDREAPMQSCPGPRAFALAPVVQRSVGRVLVGTGTHGAGRRRRGCARCAAWSADRAKRR